MGSGKANTPEEGAGKRIPSVRAGRSVSCPTTLESSWAKSTEHFQGVPYHPSSAVPFPRPSPEKSSRRSTSGHAKDMVTVQHTEDSLYVHQQNGFLKNLGMFILRITVQQFRRTHVSGLS